MLFSFLKHVVKKLKSFPKAEIKAKVSLALNTVAPMKFLKLN